MTLLQFLHDLAADPTRQLQFRRDPEGMARACGVPEALIPALVSRDSARLRGLLAGEGAEASAFIYSPEASATIYSPEASAIIYSPEVRA